MVYTLNLSNNSDAMDNWWKENGCQGEKPVMLEMAYPPTVQECVKTNMQGENRPWKSSTGNHFMKMGSPSDSI